MNFVQEEITPETELERLAVEAVAACRRYREHAKRHRPAILRGVLFIETDSGEMVVYSEGSQRHREMLMDVLFKIGEI